MSVFDEAFELVLKFEGGYVNDPNDPGGETKYGISKKAYPGIDIKCLAIDQAKEIYRRDFWYPARCERIAKFSPALAILHFDTAVNAGLRNAAKILQRAINRHGFNIKVDGIIGQITLSHLKACNQKTLIRDYALERIAHYTRITKNKNLRKFLRGWIRRTLEVLNEVLYR